MFILEGTQSATIPSRSTFAKTFAACGARLLEMDEPGMNPSQVKTSLKGFPRKALKFLENSGGLLRVPEKEF